MATARRRSIPASDFRWDEPLAGIVDGVNATFTIPYSEKAFHSLGGLKIRPYKNGQRKGVGVGCDVTVTESGGPGTGFDTVVFATPPKVGDTLTVDYIVKR